MIERIPAIFRPRLGLALFTFAAGALVLLAFGGPLLAMLNTQTQLLPASLLATLLLIQLLELHHSLYGELVYTENVNPFVKPALISGVAIIILSVLLTPRLGVWGMLLATGLVQLCFNNWWPGPASDSWLGRRWPRLLAPILTMRWFQSFFRNQPFVDRTLCHFLVRRLTLPALSLADLFPNFDQRIVSIGRISRGSWSTPLADLVMLLKIALCTEPRQLMEIGSYLGYTALVLAQHIARDARIVTIDRHPDHGEAYLGTSFASMIERRVGNIDRPMFARDKPGSYDLIFVDAAHAYENARNDTELVLPLLSTAGFIVWHDYANWGYFSGQNGVPEYLSELSARLPIGQVPGSSLAIHSPAWLSGAGRERFHSATEAMAKEIGSHPWQGSLPRG
jgi:hypothetical protein